MRCNNGNGWLKLHRKVLENPYAMKNRDYFSIWIYLLLNVAYEPTETLFNNEKITLQPGQGVFTITEISTKLGVSRRGTQVVLNRYRDEGMICTEVKRWNTLISIVGWNEYQSCDTEVERKWNGDDTEVKSLHIYKELKKGRSKEYSDEVEVIKPQNIIPPTYDMVADYCAERKNGIDPQAFMDYYDERDWTRNGKPLKDWHRAMHTWERNQKKYDEQNKQSRKGMSWLDGIDWSDVE